MRTKLAIGLLIMFILVAAGIYLLIGKDLSPEDQSAAVVTAQELKDIGLFDVTTFGADKTGVTDSTRAIQDAIDQAYKKKGAAFFPPGTYLVSDSLVALKDRTGSIGPAFHIIGSTAGAELPTIKLKSNSFNDGKSNNDTVMENGVKKAVIHMWACKFVEKNTDGGKTECDPPYNDQLGDVNNTNGNTAMLLGNSIQNLRFVIEPNNPDAIGIRITGNQRNALSNIVVESTDAFAGIYGSVGTNSVNQDITVIGGKYGVYGSYGGWGAYTNVTLKNQEILAFTSHNGPPVSVNGFEIVKDSAPAVGEVVGVNYTGDNTHHNGALSFNDGVINFRNSSEDAAFITPQGNQIVAVNVFVNKAAHLVQTEDQKYPGNANGWSKINTFANTMPEVGYKLVEGQETQTDYAPDGTFVTQNVSAPDAYKLKMNHGVEKGKILSPDQLLSLSKTPGSGVVNVVDKGMTPLALPLNNNAPDYSEKLNELFADPTVKYVFVPKGIYPIKNTLTLGKDTMLIGVSPEFSIIRSHPQWRPNGKTDVLTTVNDASATTMIANIKIQHDASKDNDKFDTIHWKAGKKSVIYYINADTYGALGPDKCRNTADRYGRERFHFHFTGNGGGRVWGTTLGGGGCSKYHQAYRGLFVNGTTQPLIIYGFNPEDGHGETIDKREGYQSEIRNAKNVSIRSHKSEDANSLLVRNSQNIFILNPGGSVQWSLRENSDYMILNTVSKFIQWENKTTGGTVIKDMIEEEIGGNVTRKFRSNEAVSIIKRGNVDLTVWDRDSVVPPVSITDTPVVTSTSSTTTPTPSVTNTSGVTPPSGNACGKSDIDGDGKFEINDFQGFAQAYGMGNRDCDDTSIDYGPCGGRDANRDGKLDIIDFGGVGIGFAQRYYPKTSCAL